MGIYVLLGPVLFIRDVSPANQVFGFVLFIVLLPAILIGILRPRPWSMAVSIIAGLVWLLMGVVGAGIDC